MLKNSSILITGGTGSFGRALIDYVLRMSRPRRLVIYSRDELKQSEMQEKYPVSNSGPVRYFIGDVRDKDRLVWAMDDIDLVIHAAALKQVPAAEYNPFEVVKTNVIGAQNVIESALARNVARVVALSTDKAAAPDNLYGATKLTSDKMFVAANNFAGSKDTKFSVVRYGNVFNSRGSVVPYFLRQKETGAFSITDKRMTRFSITLTQGVHFVLACAERMLGGEIFVPKIPSYRLTELATAISPDCEQKVVGVRPGEKLHEEMITTVNSRNTVEFSDYYVILPAAQPRWDVEKMIATDGGKYVPEGFSYNSEDNPKFLTVLELRDLVNKETREKSY